MKRGSNLLLTLSFLLAAGAAWSSAGEGLFSIVPPGDPTYDRLKRLEADGILPASSAARLTRIEVAERIFAAEKKIDGIIVAQADMALPPPPPDAGGAAGTPLPPSDNSSAGAGSAAVATSLWDNPQKLADAEKNLKSLKETYDLEVQVVQEEKDAVQGDLSDAEAAQYGLSKSLKGIAQYPSVSIHGTGRMFGTSEQASFDTPSYHLDGMATRKIFGYLDLEPTGSVSKEVRWLAVIRLGTQAIPLTNSEGITVRRVSINFNPDFMSADLGDFYESYTPFTIWNRNDLDLFYKPEMIDRMDRFTKYENFLEQEPAWLFRGARVGTAIGWPDSTILEQAKFSTFAHMIRNGFAEQAGQFVGNDIFTDWVFGGTAEVKSKKWFLGETNWQFILDSYGVILDEPLDTTAPGSTYNPTVPGTWAHQYLIGSLKPTLRVGLGDDVYTGVSYEGAYSSFQDDKQDPARVITDYALTTSAFFQVEDSKISLSFLDVGPNYFSPLAQIRQDSMTDQFFLKNVPRANAIFGLYPRYYDNTFPYGLATPNRQGGGLDLDIETLTGKSLKIRGAAYLVHEIGGNLVVNNAGTGYTGLDTAPNGTIPVRDFAYLNLGPSIDLGPFIGLTTPLEFGTDLRFEETTSTAGTLDSVYSLTGLRAGLFPWWETSVAFGVQYSNGTEMTLNGGGYARTSYLFDNADLGSYQATRFAGGSQDFYLSTVFKFDRNSNLYLDYELLGMDAVSAGAYTGTNYNNIWELTYEVEF